MKPARTVRLGDGRTLAYAEWGDPNGSPVIECHGNPGCRVLVWDEGVAASHDHHRPARDRALDPGAAAKRC